MTEKFFNQVAVISGGADGLCKAIALRLGTAGVKLTLFDKDPNKLRCIITELTTAGYTLQDWELI